MVRGSVNTVINWNYFCLNFSSDFIRKCWIGDERMIKHLKERFNEIYERRGTLLMPLFFTQLDAKNQVKLVKWVNDNYLSWPDLKTDKDE